DRRPRGARPFVSTRPGSAAAAPDAGYTQSGRCTGRGATGVPAGAPKTAVAARPGTVPRVALPDRSAAADQPRDAAAVAGRRGAVRDGGTRRAHRAIADLRGGPPEDRRFAGGGARRGWAALYRRLHAGGGVCDPRHTAGNGQVAAVGRGDAIAQTI